MATTTGNSAGNSAAMRLAAGQTCQRYAPGLHAAAGFLPGEHRHAAHTLFAVYWQLRQIMGSRSEAPAPPTSPGQTNATPLATHSACVSRDGAASAPGFPASCPGCGPGGPPGNACQTPGGACSTDSTCGDSSCASASCSSSSRAGSPACAGSADACQQGADCCGGTSLSPEGRARICSAVLDHLYSGEPTGKPELDGFHQVIQRYALPREPWDRLTQAMVEDAQTRRYATWDRLRRHFDASAGAMGELGYRLLAGAEVPPAPSPAGPQLLAWCAAMRLVGLIRTIPEDWRAGRLLVPLDDLIKAGLSEADVARFSERGSTEGDPRWRSLIEALAERARNLFTGGAKCLAALPPASRRAAAMQGALSQVLLRTLLRAGGDPFSYDPKPTFWRRLQALPMAVRLSM